MAKIKSKYKSLSIHEKINYRAKLKESQEFSETALRLAKQITGALLDFFINQSQRPIVKRLR